MKQLDIRKWHFLKVSAAILLVLLFATLSIVALKSKMLGTKDAPVSISEEEDFQNADFERDGKWYGLCDKNKVHSIEDFRRTVSEDPALRLHYANFNWENARMGKLQKPILAYVYFKKDGKIFRKGKPIQLAAGDEFITDGKTTVRTFCCNEFAAGDSVSELDVPAAATDSSGLTAHNMHGPASPPVHSAPGGASGGVMSASGGRAGGGSVGGSGGGSAIVPLSPPVTPHNPDDPGGPDKPNEPPKPVPEPRMMFLIGVGFAVFFIAFLVEYYYVRRKKVL